MLIEVTEENAGANRTLLYALLVYGVLLLGVGVFLVASPHETLKVLTIAVGLCLIVDGVIVLVAAAAGSRDSRSLLALVGIVSVIAGLVLVKKPFEALYVFVAVIGIWCVVAGLMRCVYAFTVREGRALYITAALIEITAGVLILAWSDVTLSAFAVIVGIMFVLRGIACIYGAWQGLRLERAGDKPGLPLPA